MRAQNKKTGFTLVELLVVIAIIGIVIGILFPVLAQSRERTRQVTCLSNIRQIGFATLMYVQGYDGMFPPAFISCTDQRTWHHALQSYVRKRIPVAAGAEWSQSGSDFWHCPSGSLGTKMSCSTNPMLSGAFHRRDCTSPSRGDLWEDAKNIALVENPAQVPSPMSREEAGRVASRRDRRPLPRKRIA
jgi:prepilin-type N-terminal cleavage/methylation domain-containing protein